MWVRAPHIGFVDFPTVYHALVSDPVLSTDRLFDLDAWNVFLVLLYNLWEEVRSEVGESTALEVGQACDRRSVTSWNPVDWILRRITCTQDLRDE